MLMPWKLRDFWRGLPSPLRYSLIGASAYAAFATAVYLVSAGWRVEGATVGLASIVFAYYSAASIIGIVVHAFPGLSSRLVGRMLLGYGSALIAFGCLALAMLGPPWHWGEEHLFAILLCTAVFGTYLASNWRTLFRPIGT